MTVKKSVNYKSVHAKINQKKMQMSTLTSDKRDRAQSEITKIFLLCVT